MSCPAFSWPCWDPGIGMPAFPKNGALCVCPEAPLAWLCSADASSSSSPRALPCPDKSHWSGERCFPCRSYLVTTREFMNTDFVILSQEATFHDILQVVTMTDAQEYPVVDTAGKAVFRKQRESPGCASRAGSVWWEGPTLRLERGLKPL